MADRDNDKDKNRGEEDAGRDQRNHGNIPERDRNRGADKNKDNDAARPDRAERTEPSTGQRRSNRDSSGDRGRG